MKTFRLSIWFVAIVLLASSCQVKCKKGEGPHIVKSRNTEAITKLVCDIPCTIYVSQGDQPVCTVEAAESLQDLILVDSKGGGKVKISSKKCFSDLDTVIVRVTSPKLKEIRIKGTAKVYSQGVFTADDLKLIIDGSGTIDLVAMLNELESEINGAGDINLRGSALKHKITINGTGNVSASEFNNYDCNVKITGPGSCHLFVNNKLKAEIDGTGDIFYKGSPEIKTTITGTGKVQKE